MQDAKEEVRSRINIEDVVGEYVQLKRAGRNFKGLSPFSGEKTPSFFVSPDKHIWHDFSSNKGGDVFSFVMEVEGMDFRQALEHLARKAGVDLTPYESKGSQEIAKKKKRLYAVLDLAASYYQHSLINNPHALEYVFKKRGLDKKTVESFKIGYAPDNGDALVQFLTRKGYTMHELDDAGLVNRYGGDLFRGRMTVPLMDGSGQVIGFTARILADIKDAPKYLNTPQTLLYDKGRHVFGLSQAKEAIRTNDYAVIVEGNLDVVSSHQVDISQVVATAGTAMTENHLRALRRLTGNVRLAFDGDKAGIAATERAIPIAQTVGVELTIISLPDGAKDPDELIQKDPKLWLKAIESAQPIIDWILDQYAKREDLTTATGKQNFVNEGLRLLQLIESFTVREHYVMVIAEKTGGSAQNLLDQLSTFVKEKASALKSPSIPLDTQNYYDEQSFQDNLLSVPLIDTATHELFRNVDVRMFQGEDRQAIAQFIKDHPGAKFDTTPVDLQNYDTYVKILLLKADARYADWNDQDRYFETARLLRQVAYEHKKQQKDLLISQLRDAETIGDEAMAVKLRAQLHELIKEMTSGQR